MAEGTRIKQLGEQISEVHRQLQEFVKETREGMGTLRSETPDQVAQFMTEQRQTQSRMDAMESASQKRYEELLAAIKLNCNTRPILEIAGDKGRSSTTPSRYPGSSSTQEYTDGNFSFQGNPSVCLRIT